MSAHVRPMTPDRVGRYALRRRLDYRAFAMPQIQMSANVVAQQIGANLPAEDPIDQETIDALDGKGRFDHIAEELKCGLCMGPVSNWVKGVC